MVTAVSRCMAHHMAQGLTKGVTGLFATMILGKS